MPLSHSRLLLTLTLSTLFVPAALATSSSAQRARSEPSFPTTDGQMVYCPAAIAGPITFRAHRLARRERWSQRERPVSVPRIPKEMVDEPLEFDTPTTGTAKIYHPHATAAPPDADAAQDCAPPEGAGAAFYPQSFGNVPSTSAEPRPAVQPAPSVPMRRSPTPEARRSPTPEARAGTPRSVVPTPEPRARTPAIYLSLEQFPHRLSPAGIPRQANSPPSGRLVNMENIRRQRQRPRGLYFEGSPEDQEVASASEAPKSSASRVNSPAFDLVFARAKVPSPVELKAAHERAKSRSPFRSMQDAEEGDFSAFLRSRQVAWRRVPTEEARSGGGGAFRNIFGGGGAFDLTTGGEGRNQAK